MTGDAPPSWRAAVDGHLAAGRIDDAAAMLSALLADVPDDVDALRHLARIRAHQGQHSLALELQFEAEAMSPDTPGIDYELGVTLLALGNWDEAIRRIEKSLDQLPDNADGWLNLAWALRRSGRSERAATSLRRALALRPDWISALFNLGNLLLDDLGDPAAAIPLFDAALKQAPDTIDILNNLAMAHWRCGQTREAEALFRRIIARHPDSPMASNNLGNLLTMEARADEAEALFATAIANAPTAPLPRLNYGLLLLTLNRLQDAVRVLTEASRLGPDLAETWNALGLAFLRQENLDAAEDALERAIALRGDFAEAHANLANLASARARPDEALAAFRRARALAPRDTRIHSNMLFFLIHGGCLGRAEVLAEHRRFGLDHEGSTPAMPAVPPPDATERRIRVGYVSPDFCDHALIMWFEHVLERHDPERFDVFCYPCGPRRDHVTERLMRLGPQWRNLHGVPVDAAARMIRDDGIDILVDLAGHSANNALPIFIRKPSPIQATMIGYPFTTGLRRIDYCVSDIFRDPLEGCAGDYTEMLERLPVPLAFRPPPDAPLPQAPPSSRGVAVRFGSFNKPQKITAATMAAWAAILARAPRSTLLLVVPGGDEPPVRRHFREIFAAHGVDGDRIDTVGTGPLQTFLHLLNGVDVALDPFPYGGGTTAMLSLWMGVPSVTLDGANQAGRIAAAAQDMVGLSRFNATTFDGYVDIGAAVAADPGQLPEIRRSLRSRLAASPMMDEQGYVAALEAAYLRWWARHRAGTP